MTSRKISKKSTGVKNRQKQEPKWQTMEKVVAILEKVLTPTARVEHDVCLPVLGRPEREPRQCDIVITYGTPPRQTITIVEVQCRTSKPNITMFHGWVQKMQEVGAQHLICVSVLGYPQSIIDDVANRYGPTIKLMTLQELKEIKLPGLTLSNYLLYKKPQFSFESIGPGMKLDPIPPSTSLGLSSDDKAFTLDDDKRLDLYELTSHILNQELSQLFLNQGIPEPDSYSIEITLGSQNKIIYLYVEEQKCRIIELPMKLRIETEIVEVPVSCFAYEQLFVDGVLAWVTSVSGIVEEQEFLTKIVYKQDEKGFLQIAAVQVQGVEVLTLDLYTDESAWGNAISQNSNH